ncbi:hypothetical protein NL676_027645 [Syzygium grande]|nr:hypothetical protein NL676_027645 [Syzygium grande]
MASSVNAHRVLREIEVVVVDVKNVPSQGNGELEPIISGIGLETPGSSAGRSPGESASSSQESSAGNVRELCKELPVHENPRVSPKSRLLDPPEDQWQQRSRIAADGGDAREEEEDDFEDIPEEYKHTKLSLWTVLQVVSLVLMIAALVCSLWINALKRQKLWDLPLWKWESMVFALICGNLLTGWLIRLAMLLIERSFILRKRILYFVYGLKKSVLNCIWFGIVLLVWNCVFSDKVEKETKNRILPRVTKILVCILISAVVWLLKTLLVKDGGANIPSDIRETLAPRSDKFVGNRKSPIVAKSPRLSREASCEQDMKIPIKQLHRLNQKNVSAWNMKRLMNIIRNGTLSTLDEPILRSDVKDGATLQIRSEREAEKAAKRIFQNVAKRGSKCIYLEDVMRFMSKDEAYMGMDLFGAASAREGISWQSHKNWVVNAFTERRAPASSLNDIKTAVDKLQKMLNVVIAFIILIICLAILQVDVTHFLIVISSRSFLSWHLSLGIPARPFSKLSSTYSVLATKPIGNYYRSPNMGDGIDFSIHVLTPAENVAIMKERIVRYIESRSDHWHSAPMVVTTEIESLNRVLMSVWLTHRMNHQDMGERFIRRVLLVEEMIKIFKELDIAYRLRPLDVNIQSLPNPNLTRLPSNWTAGESRAICRYICDKYADKGNMNLYSTKPLVKASIECSTFTTRGWIAAGSWWATVSLREAFSSRKNVDRWWNEISSQDSWKKAVEMKQSK